VTKLNTHTGAITLVGAGGASVSSVTAAGGATITITAGSGGGGGGGGLVDSVNGLTGTVVLSSVSVSAASAVHTHSALDITVDVFDRDRLPFATSKAVGVVQASAGLTVNGVGHLSADVQSVAGRTGAITISTTDVSLFATAAAAAAPVQNVNGSTGAVVLNAASVTAAGTAVVSALNGLTGSLTISGQAGVSVTAAGSTISLAAAALTDSQRYVLARAAARLTN
jgi:hypothetical protein